MAANGNGVTREALDRLVIEGCEQCKAEGLECEHGPLFLHSRCHPRGKTTVLYENGLIYVSCGKCRKPVVTIKVALGTAP